MVISLHNYVSLCIKNRYIVTSNVISPPPNFLHINKSSTVCIPCSLRINGVTGSLYLPSSRVRVREREREREENGFQRVEKSCGGGGACGCSRSQHCGSRL